jgi:DNA-binding winged helix-turn-helix (wHTH) protein/Tol biopolymer transport system component
MHGGPRSRPEWCGVYCYARLMTKSGISAEKCRKEQKVPTQPDQSTRYEFDGFTVDLGHNALLQGKAVIPLPSRAFDALVYLIENRERSVPKDELIAEIWQGVVVTEDSLVHAISVLRRTLGDERHDPKYIQTIPRRGYRFVGSAQAVDLPPSAERAGTESAGTESASTGSAGTGSAAGTRPTESADPAPARAAAAPAGPLRLAWPTVLASAALALVASIGFEIARDSGERQPPSSLFLYQPAPPNTAIDSGGIVSPDGRYLAFIARDETTGQSSLWLRALSSDSAIRLPGTAGASKPFWSPDSRRIAYFAKGELRVTDIDGAAPRTLTPVFAAAGGSWGPDDTILFAEWSSGLYAIPVSGDGGLETIVTLDREAKDIAYAWPQFMGDSRRYLYQIMSLDPDRSGIYAGDRATQQSVKLLGTTSPAILAPPNHLLHVENDLLIAEELDPERSTLTGRAFVVARDVAEPTLAADNALSASADLLAFQQDIRRENLAWYDRDGRRLATLATPTALYNPRLSPSGMHLVGTGAVTTDPGLWLVSLDREEYLRLETDAIGPVWSPDGRRVAFTSRDGSAIYVRAVDDATERQQLLTGDGVKILSDWSPDGRALVYSRFEDGNDLDLWLVDIATAGTRPWLATAHSETQARISPDGRWVAYASDETGAFEVYVARYPDFGDRQQISLTGGGQPQWRADQGEIYFLAPDKTIMAAALGEAWPQEPALPRRLFPAEIAGDVGDARDHFSASGDGSRFLVVGASSHDDDRAITIMVNWTAAGMPAQPSEPGGISQALP